MHWTRTQILLLKDNPDNALFSGPTSDQALKQRTISVLQSTAFIFKNITFMNAVHDINLTKIQHRQ